MKLPVMTCAETGRYAEEYTVRYLRLSGYKILSRNYSVRNIGELDIVAEKYGMIYSIEVKGRRQDIRFAGHEGLVPGRKLRRIMLTTSMFLDNTGRDHQNCKIVMAFVHIAANDFHNKIMFITLK